MMGDSWQNDWESEHGRTLLVEDLVHHELPTLLREGLRVLCVCVSIACAGQRTSVF